MNTLDQKDLDRFSWDKMSGGIEKKIEEKKRKQTYLYVTIIGAAIISALAGFWFFTGFNNHYKSNQANAASISSTPSINKSNTINFQHSTLTTDTKSSDIQKASTSAKTPIITKKNGVINNELNKQIVDSNSAVIPDKNNLIRITKKNIEGHIINKSDGANLKKENIPSSIKRLKVANHGIVKSSTRKIDSDKNSQEINRSLGKRVSFLATLPIKELKLDEERKPTSAQSIHTPSRLEKANSSIALAYNTNTLLNHPGNSLIGSGVNLGSWIPLSGRHYVGFEFSVQHVNYQFEFAPEAIVISNKETSDNKINFYSIPLYYGYIIHGHKTIISLEAGINLNIINFVKGEVSPANNNLSIIKVEDGNYYKKSFGSSILLRTKIEFLADRPVGIFTRFGTHIALSNWHKDDSFKINPISINVDLGVRKNF